MQTVKVVSNLSVFIFEKIPSSPSAPKIAPTIELIYSGRNNIANYKRIAFPDSYQTISKCEATDVRIQASTLALKARMCTIILH